MSRQIASQIHQQKPSVTLSPASLLQRKCACGNHTIASGECEECRKKQRLGLQTKLRVNEPGHIYEQEADRIADQVMAAPVQSKVSGAPQRVLRLAGQLPRLTDIASASVEQALANPGTPLEPALQQDMEHRFGYDFSGVRVHSGDAAEQSARDFKAHAYTVGRDIVFGVDRFAPGTMKGRQLLAHELTHVVQQSRLDGIRLGQGNEKCILSVPQQDLSRYDRLHASNTTSDLAEEEANKVSESVSRGQSIPEIRARVFPSRVSFYRTPRDSWLTYEECGLGMPWLIEYDDESGISILRIHTSMAEEQYEPGALQYQPQSLENALGLPSNSLSQDEPLPESDEENNLLLSYEFFYGALEQQLVQQALENLGLIQGSSDLGLGVDQVRLGEIRIAVSSRRPDEVIRLCSGLNEETEEAVATELWGDIVGRFGTRVLEHPNLAGIRTRVEAAGPTRIARLRVPATRRGYSSRFHETAGPRTTSHSGRISLSEEVQRSGMPPVSTIDYIIELNRAHGETQERYVLYVTRINDSMSLREFLTSSEPSYCEEPVDELAQSRRAVLLLELISDAGVYDRSEPFEEHEMPQGTPAYVFTVPERISVGIREELRRQRPGPTRSEPFEEMPLGETPGQWSAGEYSQTRREEAIDWLAFLVGEPVRTHTLGHVRYDTDRLLRSSTRLGWIRQFRRFLRDGTTPQTPPASELDDFYNYLPEGQEVSREAVEVDRLRQILLPDQQRGAGDAAIRHFWNNEFLPSLENWPEERGGLLRCLQQVRCNRLQAVANRLVREIETDASQFNPLPEDGSAEMMALRSRLTLQGPSDAELIQFWQSLISPVVVEEGETEEEVETRLANLFMDTRYGEASLERLAVPAVIRVEDFGVHFDRLGIDMELRNADGNASADRWGRFGLDPQFLVAFLQFSSAIASPPYNVRRIFTAGFYRPPLSPSDAHAVGRAIDVTGFGIQSGDRIVPLRLSNNPEQSAWLDHLTLLPDGRTYRQAMVQVAEVMARYFSWIGGPGRDPAHNDHFHCEIERRGQVVGETEPQRIFAAPATPLQALRPPSSRHHRRGGR
jgi:hypothetical protein